MRRPLALLLLVLLAPAARAGSGPGTLAVPPEVLAGSTLRLDPGPLPRESGEFEILLSLDDGRTWPLRATREQDAGRREIRWRVPNLSASRARLRVRFESGGREVDGPISASFRIAGRSGAQELRAFHEGNWWEGLQTAPGSLPTRWSSGDTPSIAAHSSGEAFESSQSGAAPDPPAAIRIAVPGSWMARQVAPRGSAISTRSQPLRN